MSQVPQAGALMLLAGTGPRPMVALDLYARGLAGVPLTVEYEDGARSPLPTHRWRLGLRPGDDGLLAAVNGPALDVGCGPGRLAAALAAVDVFVLGIDISAAAVSLARAAGVNAVRADVFGRVPGEGRWRSVLLADGNVGIGGRPATLLRRAARLLTSDGTVLVETDPPGAVTREVRARLHGDGSTSAWFRWAHVGAGDLTAIAQRAGLRRTHCWTEAGRWFSTLAWA